MGDESVKTKDEITLVLYDKDGKVKQIIQKKQSKWKRFLKLIGKVL